MNADTAWYLRINSWARHSPRLHTVLAGYALWGGLSLLAVLLVGTWWRSRREGVRAVAVSVLTGLASVVALLVNQQLVSPLVGRARPCQMLAHVEVLLACSRDYSMPSDHCVIAGAFVVGLWMLRRSVGVPAAVAALLLALARVYVGVHYPVDTVVGLALGALIGLGVVVGLRSPAARLVERLHDTRYAVLVSAAPAAGDGGDRR